VSTAVTEDLSNDTYSVVLTRQPAVDETVTVSLSIVGTAEVTTSASALVFTHANWNTAQVVTVSGTHDTDPENTLERTIRHTVMSDGPVYGGVTEKFDVEVTVRDNDAGGLIVTPTDGTTLVAEGINDTYTLQLTREPTDDVVVSILTDGRTLVAADGDPLGRMAVVDGVTTVTFNASNWSTAFSVLVSVNPDAEEDSGQPVQTFPAQPHNTAQINGPLIIEGSPIPGKDRSIKPALMLPSELDSPLPVLSIETDESIQTDTLNVFNDNSQSADIGMHGAILAGSVSGLEAVYEVNPGELVAGQFAHIGGLGMGAGLPTLEVDFGSSGAPDLRQFQRGITYHGVEVVDVLLGQKNDNFTVSHTVDGVITVVQGGGGDDTITVTGGGGSNAPLVVFGDSSQDGTFYNSTTVELTAYLDGKSSIVPFGREFSKAGNDTIDASASSLGVTIYGGGGNDTIRGSQAGDHLAGGSGDDKIYGESGVDHIYGDAGVNLDLSKRLSLAGDVIAIVNNDAASEPTKDGLAAGSDRIYGGSGDDIVFGDYGVVTQTAATQRIRTTGNVERIETVNPALGVGDEIHGDAGVDRILGGQGGDTITGDADADIVLGDHGFIVYNGDIGANLSTVDEVQATQPDQGGSDTIDGNDGADVLIGGAAGDTVSGNAGNDVIFGDGAVVLYNGGVISSAESIDTATGGIDTLYGNDGDDLIVGGAEGDTASGNIGNDVVFGDNARVRYTSGAISFAESTDTATGGVDTLNGNENDDLIIGGAFGDIISGGSGNDIALGDNAEVLFGVQQRVETTARTTGGSDTIRGNEGQDVLIGGAAGDRIDGGSNEDLIFGDNVRLDRALGSDTNPRFRGLLGG
jgi:Ca2+-binding RTX toxin-like protein